MDQETGDNLDDGGGNAEQLKQRIDDLQAEIRLLRMQQLANQGERTQEQSNQGAQNQRIDDVAAVSTCKKLPKFWRSKPDIWFIQIEAMFRNRNIRHDRAKFDAVLEALDEEAIAEVTDILANPPEENKYEKLKESLIKRFMDSAERQLHILLSEIQLGDKKPSQLLRSMKDLARNEATEELLKTKWLALLPRQVHNTLMVLADSSLDKLAEVADKIMENNTNSVMSVDNNQLDICAIGAIKSSEGKILETRIGQVEKKLDIIIQSLEKRPSRQDGGYRERSRSLSRMRSHNEDGVCKFHQRFQERSYKCLNPCNFKPADMKGN